MESNALPHQSDDLFLSDAGMETYFIFQQGVTLPFNVSYILMESEEGIARLRDYYDHYLAIAREYGTGFVFESPTWRASPDWAAKLGTSPEKLRRINKASIDLLADIRDSQAGLMGPMVISANIGPRGDGYRPGELMSEHEAADYHATQVGHFAGTAAQMVSAFTMTNAPEVIGITRAAQAQRLPVVVSFTVETDGRLPTGQHLRDAIAQVDEATGFGPAYYMINCAHPEHFGPAFEAEEAWTLRVRGLRANSSNKSHAELDESPTLDEGNPQELGEQYRQILRRFPHINVLGGCCGTDHRHVREIAAACAMAV